MKNHQELLFSNTEEDLKNAYEEYDITEKYIQDGMDLLMEWYRKQPHLPYDALDDVILKRFYSAAKYRTEKAKVIIDSYFTVRTKFPEFFEDRNPFKDDIWLSHESVEFIMMPKITHDNNRIVITRYTEKDASFLDPVAVFKLIFMMSELRLRYETVQGDLYIWDLKHLKMGHIMKFHITLLRKAMFIAQNCYCSRIKAIYILNAPSYAVTTINLIKGFLSKKLANRFFGLESLEELHNHIKPEYLPIEMGGSDFSCRNVLEMYKETMQSEEWVDRFKEFGEKKSNESRRPPDSIQDLEQQLGIMGSFHKLDID